MINVNELRIGNIVSTPNPNQKYFRIDGISRNGVDEWGVESYQHIDVAEFMKDQPSYIQGIAIHPLTWDCKDLIPIPLTPEILEEIGFEKENINSETGVLLMRKNVAVDKRYIVSIYNNKYEFLVDCGEFYQRLSRIEFVHQFQNLYYALTGKELEIKL